MTLTILSILDSAQGHPKI